MKETAKVAEPIAGNKLYQKRAREVLPILVRQAEAEAPIFYSALAEELEITNPRVLNYPLGSIGQTLERLSKVWEERIPPIQCLVINKKTRLPGTGIGPFLTKSKDFSALPRVHQERIVKAELRHIFGYHRWREVLSTLSLPYSPPDFAQVSDIAGAGAGGGESEAHRRLKEFVARNPRLLGLPRTAPVGETEAPLLSGDFLDVSFERGGEWVAAEVKPRLSARRDLIRGLFQCVKYRAVMQATDAWKGQVRRARAVLVLEGVFPKELTRLRNTLGVEVLDEVAP